MHLFDNICGSYYSCFHVFSKKFLFLEEYWFFIALHFQVPKSELVHLFGIYIYVYSMDIGIS